ncbi:DUF1569 domain-containing protein [Blastopirellula sp. JC732]|uniref:DUF1569 domain-containing protein n=1 Tax=Blastopirellula sediminis TaxID=2894196 RepID=A0A9X1SF23_9BACT|nr:DUF1569 domain-containing protein [Blastopirellula sediminis]MCC9609385.1 DUF1569 domain-containing protein [Blastopirellula sediminis]MCC9627838.1 DUF1569 domain-containing protein [Blastopirellula sediminis]
MRRQLQLERLPDAIAECERLLRTGYTQSGNWTLAQICRHLRLTIESNMKGYPVWMTTLGYPLRPILRHFMLPRLLTGNSPSGIRTAGMFVPPDDLDDAVELERLKECVTRFVESTLPLHAHPGFGNMTHEEFNRFHAAHAAHHLSFLHPQTADAG